MRSAGPVLDATNPLTGIPVEVSYEYNGDGLRTGKGVAVDGEEVHLGDTWDHSTSVPLLLSAGLTGLWYGPGGMPVAQSPAPLVSNYLHTDRLNSVRAVTDASGHVTATASYDAYGRQTGTIDPVSTPLGFAGERQDTETGFVYLRARYYDPSTGRFLNRDPLVGLTGQPYAYANNDPLNTVDPTGLIGFQIGPVKVGDGCPLGKNPNGSCRGSDASNSLKVGAAALGGTALLAGAVVIAVPTAAVAGVSVATIGTALAIGSTAASWGVAGVDCSRSRDRNCAASIAEAMGGTVMLGSSRLAFRAGDALLGTASNVTGWALDQAAFLKFPNSQHGRAASGVPGAC
ncbi:MAG: RHS repeat-associated core domain-containing protein [Acidimicrobiales bacterium]